MELKDKREKKERGWSVRDVLEDALKESGKMKEVAIAYRDLEGYVTVNISADDGYAMIGVLETAKQLLMQEEIE